MPRRTTVKHHKTSSTLWLARGSLKSSARMVDHFHEQVLALRRVYRLTPTGTVMYGGVDTLRNVARARCIASASPDSAGIHRNPESIVFWANLAQNG